MKIKKFKNVFYKTKELTLKEYVNKIEQTIESFFLNFIIYFI